MSDDKPTFFGIHRTVCSQWHGQRPESATMRQSMKDLWRRLRDEPAQPVTWFVEPRSLRQYQGTILLTSIGGADVVYLRPKPRWLPRRMWEWLCRKVTVHEVPEYDDGMLYLGDREKRAALPIDTARLPW